MRKGSGRELPDMVARLAERWGLVLEGLLPTGARAVPGDTLDGPGATLPPPQAWAALLADLHGTPRGGVTDLLRQRCEDMFRRIGARQGRRGWRPTCLRTWGRGRGRSASTPATCSARTATAWR